MTSTDEHLVSLRLASTCVGRCAAPFAFALASLAACKLPPSDSTGATPPTVAAVPQDLQEHAVRALLINLLDDSDLPRWNNPVQPLLCGEESAVWVDGAPLVVGVEAPLASFVLEFQLDGACPLGPQGPQLWGRITLVVLRDDDAGWVPLLPRSHASVLQRVGEQQSRLFPIAPDGPIGDT